MCHYKQYGDPLIKTWLCCASGGQKLHSAPFKFSFNLQSQKLTIDRKEETSQAIKCSMSGQVKRKNKTTTLVSLWFTPANNKRPGWSDHKLWLQSWKHPVHPQCVLRSDRSDHIWRWSATHMATFFGSLWVTFKDRLLSWHTLRSVCVCVTHWARWSTAACKMVEWLPSLLNESVVLLEGAVMGIWEPSIAPHFSLKPQSSTVCSLEVN